MNIDRSAPAVAQAEIEIAAPPEVIWAVLTDVAAWPTWNPAVKSASLDGALVPGATFRWKAGPGTITSTLQQVEPPKALAWTGKSFGITAIHSHRLRRRHQTTLVTSEESWDGLPVRLLRGSMRKTLQQAVSAGLEHLQAESERQATPGCFDRLTDRAMITTNSPANEAPCAHLLRAAAGEVLKGDPGSLITLLADPDTTAGLLTSNRSLMRAGSDGAPPHFHRRSAELFFVLDGRLTVLLDERIVTLEKGDLLVVPPGMPHAFAAAADTDADVLFVFTPGTARFDYYRLLDKAHRGDADWHLIADSQERFDNHYVDSPTWREAQTGVAA